MQSSPRVWNRYTNINHIILTAAVLAPASILPDPKATQAIPSPNKNMPIPNFTLAEGLYLLSQSLENKGAKVIINNEFKTAAVSMIWLILVYLFHTLGELCISPVGLSYVSKLVPARMIAFMFGIWYLAIAIGMKLAGMFGENVDKIANESGISYFFWMLTIISVVLGVFSIIMQPVIKKLMHGVR